MAHGEEFSNTLVITVDGTALPSDVMAMMVEGYVDDSTTVPDMFALRFTDPGGVVLSKGGFAIAAKVGLAMQSTTPSGGPQVLLEGEVTAIETELGDKGTYTVVRGYDVSHRLFRGTRTEAYVDVRASDIVSKVASRAGLSATVDTTPTLLPHVSQDGVSDWDFLRRLAAEHDRVLTVSEGRLEFARRTPASSATGGADSRQDPLVLENGKNLIHLRATLTATGQVPEVEVRGWDPATKKEVTSTKAAATPSATLGTSPASLAAKFAAEPLRVGTPTLRTQDQVTTMATSLADHVAGGFAELEGTARGNVELRAGTAVTITNVGTTFGGKYVLTSTRHEFGPQHGYRTRFSASNTSERSLYGAASASTRERPRIAGVVPAIVTNIKDPDGVGQVKVKLPWLSDTYESGWARTVHAGAGASRGAMLLPEAGDEVLVAFAEGDFNHPFVIGGLYNGKDKPAAGSAPDVDATSGEGGRRGFVTRSGMAIELVDKAGSEKITISTKDGKNKVVLDQVRNIIEIESAGDLTVKGTTRVEVSAGTDLTLKGTNVTVDASAKLELSGATMKLAGQGLGEVSAGGVLTVKGSIVKIN
jgi:uncharacterized protein involved in type VI secretion and phage assembly